MTRIVRNGRRIVVRIVLLQAGGAIMVAALFRALSGSKEAWSALAGGLIAAIGSALVGWRMFAPGIAAADTLRRAMFAGEALKWIWYVAAVWVAFTRVRAVPLPLLVGLIVAQFSYWAGLVGMKNEGH